MSKKPKAIFAWDIVPDKWYLPARPECCGLDDLIKVDCDKTTTGWQRGHVITSVPSWGKVYVRIYGINGYCGTLTVKDSAQDYRYAFRDGSYVNLFEVPFNWIDEKLAAMESDINARKQRLEEIRKKL